MSWLPALWLFRRAPDARAEAEIAADVRAELEHHLACAERELLERGYTPEEARAEARRRFGDVERVHGTCLRLQTGGRLMLQRLHFVATLLLLVAVVGLAWSNVAFRREALAQAHHQRVEAEARLQAALEAQAQIDPLRIHTGDKLELIDFHGALHATETVAEDGKILVPEVGWVSVAGLTREEAEALLTKTLAAYFLDPDVKVKVVERKTVSKSTVFFPSF